MNSTRSARLAVLASAALAGVGAVFATAAPAQAAVVDVAVAAAGNQDHKIIIYPGMAHTMNITPKFVPAFGEPDQQVVTEIRGWLKSHR